jgi:hypothetical protein
MLLSALLRRWRRRPTARRTFRPRLEAMEDRMCPAQLASLAPGPVYPPPSALPAQSVVSPASTRPPSPVYPPSPVFPPSPIYPAGPQ